MMLAFAIIGAIATAGALVIGLEFLRFWWVSKKAEVRSSIPKVWITAIGPTGRARDRLGLDKASPRQRGSL